MRYYRVPDQTVQRLPFYLRGALHLHKQGAERISSRQLSEQVGVYPWLIRKDLSYFGDFGTPGVGYSLDRLIKHIKRALTLHIEHQVALVGVGNLGAALIAYPGFVLYGLKIAAAFDTDRTKIGQTISGLCVEDISFLELLSQRGIDLAIIAVPEYAAQEMADALVAAGIRGILNFSSRLLVLPKKVKLITIDIAMDLARLPYYVPAR